MEPIVGMLYTMVESNYQRFKSIVAGMDQEELEFKGPSQNYNSSAQLLRHLMCVDLNWVYRIKGKLIPKELEKKYGPMLDENNQLPQVKGISLEFLLNEYDYVLNQPVEYDGNEATIQWGIWHIADHNRYHQAHINQLRKWFGTNN